MSSRFGQWIKRKGWIIAAGILALSFLITMSAQAMTSANYSLEWYMPLSGTGGAAGSPNFAIQYTVGQSVTGNSTSPHFAAGLGFWTGIWEWVIHLPLLFK